MTSLDDVDIQSSQKLGQIDTKKSAKGSSLRKISNLSNMATHESKSAKKSKNSKVRSFSRKKSRSKTSL
jgi:hypothetical protein